MTATRVRPRVVVVHRGGASFAQRDARILRDWPGHDVEVRLVDVRDVAGVVRSAREVWHADAMLSWFVSIHTVVPMIVALLRRCPVAIVPGGYEVADEPQIPYGWRGSWWRRLGVAAMLRRARHVLAVSPAIAESIRVTAPGVFPSLVPNAIEPPDEALVPVADRRYDVAATSIISDDEPTRRRKGIDLFVEAARCLPHLGFVVVGDLDWISLPPNVTVTGRLDPAAAERALGDARVYVQPSRGYEAFGSTLLEAMARGATPVVTDVGGMPFVVGDVGYVVDPDDVDALVHGIRCALVVPQPHASARRALGEFSCARRRAGLVDALELAAS